MNGIASSAEQALEIAHNVWAIPLVIRPSYVLGGRAMEIVYATWSSSPLHHQRRHRFGQKPGPHRQLPRAGAIEVDVDALSDDRQVHVAAGIMEHIEEAGVHSGDSACCLPPHNLRPETIVEELKRQTVQMALALKVVGLMNVQFAIKDGVIYVLEVNPRASRTVPFVAKATDSAIAAIAARLMAGEPLANFPMRAPYAGKASAPTRCCLTPTR